MRAVMAAASHRMDRRKQSVSGKSSVAGAHTDVAHRCTGLNTQTKIENVDLQQQHTEMGAAALPFEVALTGGLRGTALPLPR